MTLWIRWWQALWLLRPGCSHLSTFLWFSTCVVGLSIRTEHLGVTSIVRALGLEAGYYRHLLDNFHSKGIKLDRIEASGQSRVFGTDESRRKVFVLGSVTGKRIDSFSHGLAKAEGIACDDRLQRVYVCDDRSDDRSCRAFTFDGSLIPQGLIEDPG